MAAAAAVALFFFVSAKHCKRSQSLQQQQLFLAAEDPHGVVYSSKGACVTRVCEVGVLHLFSRRSPSLAAALESPWLAGITFLMVTRRWLGLAMRREEQSVTSPLRGCVRAVAGATTASHGRKNELLLQPTGVKQTIRG